MGDVTFTSPTFHFDRIYKQNTALIDPLTKRDIWLVYIIFLMAFARKVIWIKQKIQALNFEHANFI